MKAILIIGDGTSIHIQNLAKEFKKARPNLRVDLLDTQFEYTSIIDFDVRYAGNVISSWYKYIGRFTPFIWGIHVLFWSLFRKEKITYDVIHIHYLSLVHRFTMFLYKKQCRKLISVIWGSDLFKCKNTCVLKSMILSSDVVNCCTPEIEDKVQNICNGELSSDKIKSCKFGVSGLNAIREFRIKEINANHFNKISNIFFGANEEKRVITVGYNASIGQQHLAIVKSLKNIGAWDDCIFVFPMTYGGSSDYLDKVKVVLENSGLNFLILIDYLTIEDVALLRIYSDVFIQLQITDAFSGSMQEHLYAGSHVITGAWLPYNDLKVIGVSFEVIESVNDIGYKLNKDLKTLNEYKLKNASNHELIWKISSFQAVINKWLCL